MIGLKSLSRCGRYEVSTVAMAEPMWDGNSFETMVFDLSIDDEVECRRYRADHDAEAGHNELLLQIDLIESALSTGSVQQSAEDDRWMRLIARSQDFAGSAGNYTFRYSGRTYRVLRAVSGRWSCSLDGAEFAPLSSGHRTRLNAVAAMLRSVRGILCPHDYKTGQDSCPCCDAYDEA
ncbi:hypothetical protein ACIQU4_27735 [Streptomyces sp. NPDC090741]|uniref:hypothetical protein n=1 Tax=Streptomyces sp. NPDC090741 TaxID=3365967 RepID=UPI0038238700